MPLDQRHTKVVPKPWGREIVLVHTDRYVCKVLCIDAGKRLSRQFHRTKDETLMPLTGVAVLGLEDGEHLIQQDCVYHIAPRCVHRISARDSDVMILEVSTPELDDVVRLDDDYGRCDEVAK